MLNGYDDSVGSGVGYWLGWIIGLILFILIMVLVVKIVTHKHKLKQSGKRSLHKVDVLNNNAKNNNRPTP